MNARTLPYWLAGILLMMGLLLGYRPVLAQSPVRTTVLQQPVVRAVMFWMGTCGHCHYVLEEVLPPLQAQYKDQLEILLIELKTAADIDRLYQTAAAFNIPKEQVGVPFLVIGDQVLTGSEQIPAELPGLIEKHLAAGGLDYPDVPALMAVIPTPTTGAEIYEPSTLCDGETTPGPETATPVAVAAAVESEPQDPPSQTLPRSNGFSLAIGVMVGMVVSLGFAGVRFVQGSQVKKTQRSNWLEFATPVLAMLGLGVAGYLAYVETQAVSAVCGPVGDCNAVQSSLYARLFGVLPVGVLGVAGYVLILAAWTWKRFRSDRLVGYASRLIFGMAFFGTLFSLYLTYLEPFVIKVVCAWCLTSAVLITLLLLINVSPVLHEIQGSVEE
jgi:uncharacterized membrane protein